MVIKAKVRKRIIKGLILNISFLHRQWFIDNSPSSVGPDREKKLQSTQHKEKTFKRSSQSQNRLRHLAENTFLLRGSVLHNFLVWDVGVTILSF